MMHEFSLVLAGEFKDFEAVGEQFGAAFAAGDVAPRTNMGVAYADVYRETDQPLEATIRAAIREVEALGYKVQGVQIDAVEDINRELAGSH